MSTTISEGIIKTINEYILPEDITSDTEKNKLLENLQAFIGVTPTFTNYYRSEEAINNLITTNKRAFEELKPILYDSVNKDIYELKRIEKNFYFFLELTRKALLEIKDKPQGKYKIEEANLKNLLEKPGVFTEALQNAEQIATPTKAVLGELKKSYTESFDNIETSIKNLIKAWVPYRYKYYELYQENPLEISNFKKAVTEYEERIKRDKDAMDRMLLNLIQVLSEASIDKKVQSSILNLLTEATGLQFKLQQTGGGIQGESLVAYFDDIKVKPNGGGEIKVKFNTDGTIYDTDTTFKNYFEKVKKEYSSFSGIRNPFSSKSAAAAAIAAGVDPSSIAYSYLQDATQRVMDLLSTFSSSGTGSAGPARPPTPTEAAIMASVYDEVQKLQGLVATFMSGLALSPSGSGTVTPGPSIYAAAMAKGAAAARFAVGAILPKRGTVTTAATPDLSIIMDESFQRIVKTHETIVSFIEGLKNPTSPPPPVVTALLATAAVTTTPKALSLDEIHKQVLEYLKGVSTGVDALLNSTGTPVATAVTATGVTPVAAGPLASTVANILAAPNPKEVLEKALTENPLNADTIKTTWNEYLKDLSTKTEITYDDIVALDLRDINIELELDSPDIKTKLEELQTKLKDDDKEKSTVLIDILKLSPKRPHTPQTPLTDAFVTAYTSDTSTSKSSLFDIINPLYLIDQITRETNEENKKNLYNVYLDALLTHPSVRTIVPYITLYIDALKDIQLVFKDDDTQKKNIVDKLTQLKEILKDGDKGKGNLDASIQVIIESLNLSPSSPDPEGFLPLPPLPSASSRKLPSLIYNKFTGTVKTSDINDLHEIINICKDNITNKVSASLKEFYIKVEELKKDTHPYIAHNKYVIGAFLYTNLLQYTETENKTFGKLVVDDYVKKFVTLLTGSGFPTFDKETINKEFKKTISIFNKNINETIISKNREKIVNVIRQIYQIDPNTTTWLDIIKASPDKRPDVATPPTGGSSLTPMVGGQPPMASQQEKDDELVTPVSKDVTLNAIKVDVENARKLANKVNEVEDLIKELRNDWNTYTSTVPIKEFKDPRPAPLLKELQNEISKEEQKIDAITIDTINNTAAKGGVIDVSYLSKNIFSAGPFPKNVANVTSVLNVESIQNYSTPDSTRPETIGYFVYNFPLVTKDASAAEKQKLLDMQQKREGFRKRLDSLMTILGELKDFKENGPYETLKKRYIDYLQPLLSKIIEQPYVDMDKVPGIANTVTEFLVPTLETIEVVQLIKKYFVDTPGSTIRLGGTEYKTPEPLMEKIKKGLNDTEFTQLRDNLYGSRTFTREFIKDLSSTFTKIQKVLLYKDKDDPNTKTVDDILNNPIQYLTNDILQHLFLDKNYLITRDEKYLFKLNIKSVQEFINDLKKAYDGVEGYTPEDIKGINEYFQVAAGSKLKQTITEKVDKITKDTESVIKKLTDYGKKYADVNPSIKTDILYKLEPQNLEKGSEIDIVPTLNDAKRKMFLDIDANINNFRKQASSMQSTSVSGGSRRRKLQKGGDGDLKADRDSITSTLSEDTDTSLFAKTKQVKELTNKFYRIMSKATDPTTALTLQGHDSLFNMLFNKYQDSKRDPEKGEYVASMELSEGLKSNALLPREVLKIDFRDKTIFVFATLFLRLISLSIIEYLVDKSKITRLNTAVLAFLGIYTGMFLLLLLIVNLDSYKLRIVFNYVNFHANSSIGIIYPSLLWLFGGIVYYIMYNINGGNGNVATNDEDRLRLKYKIQVLSMITWIFLSLMVYIL